MYKNILLPTKGSKGCQEATTEGLKFAKAVGAKVTIVNVRPRLTVFEIMEAYHPDLRQIISSSGDAQAAKESLEQVEKLHKQAGEHFVEEVKTMAGELGVQAETMVLERANPEEGIFKAAQERGSDLIFIADHGRTGLAQAFLGDVTSKVVAHSKVPVLVHRCS
jgi:nucleotide-binding universal stress UspA family protein